MFNKITANYNIARLHVYYKTDFILFLCIMSGKICYEMFKFYIY